MWLCPEAAGKIHAIDTWQDMSIFASKCVDRFSNDDLEKIKVLWKDASRTKTMRVYICEGAEEQQGQSRKDSDLQRPSSVNVSLAPSNANPLGGMDSHKRNLSIAAEKKTEKKRCRLQKDSRKDLLHAADEEVEPETSVGPPPGRGRSGQGRGCRVPDVTQELGGQHFSLASQGQDC